MAESTTKPARQRPALREREAGKVALGPDTKRKLTKMVDEVKTLQDRIAALSQTLKAAKQELLSTMQATHTTEFSTERATAVVSRPAGKVTNIIDLVKFREAVSDDDFMASISVSITEAKKVLPEKALADITTVKQPEIKPEEVTVK